MHRQSRQMTRHELVDPNAFITTEGHLLSPRKRWGRIGQAALVNIGEDVVGRQGCTILQGAPIERGKSLSIADYGIRTICEWSKMIGRKGKKTTLPNDRAGRAVLSAACTIVSLSDTAERGSAFPACNM